MRIDFADQNHRLSRRTSAFENTAMTPNDHTTQRLQGQKSTTQQDNTTHMTT